MPRTAVQLYTLGSLAESVPSLVGRVGDTTFEGVELAGLPENPAGVAEALRESGLDVAGAHVGIEELEDDLDGTIETCETIGCDRLIVPYLDERHFQSVEAVEETAARLETLAGRVGSHGVTLGYHNHDHEFVAADGDRSAFEVLIDETDDPVAFELDVGWAVAAGADPVALLDRLAGRVPLVHVKDVADGYPVELGDGELDVDASATAAIEAGAEWLVYEHDEPADPAASLARGAAVLAELRG